jgi:hypothetical protein
VLFDTALNSPYNVDNMDGERNLLRFFVRERSSFLIFIGPILLVLCSLAFFTVMAHLFTATVSRASIYKAVNYQAKLLDKATGIPVTDGSYNIKLSIYDDPTAGNRLWTARGTTGSPTAKSIAVTNGIFSTMLGESGDNTMSLDFSTDSYYLGVTVGADAEMTPRKRMGAVPQAFNANGLIGDGYINITGTPTGSGVSGGTVYINPGSTTANYTLMGIAVNGSSKFTLDAEGDLTAAGGLSFAGNSLLTAAAISGYYAYQPGDTYARASLTNNGYLQFGAGGGTTMDTNLYRSGADALKTDDTFQALRIGAGQAPDATYVLGITGGLKQSVDADNYVSLSSGVYLATRGAVGNVTFSSKVSSGGVADSANRFQISTEGKHWWGNGTDAVDTNLYRLTADYLTTDDGLVVSGFVGIGVTNPTNALAIVANDSLAYTSWPNGGGTYGWSVDNFDAIFAKNTGASNDGDVTSILLQTYNASDNTQYKAARIGLLKTDTTNKSALAFALRLPGSNDMGEFMRITNSGYVGVGTTAPHSTLHVGGSYAVGYVAKTAAYTAGDADSVISVDTTSGNVSIYLPTATTITGRIYTIKKIVAANTVTVDPSGSQTIDDSTTATLSSQWSYITVISNGADWLKIAGG